MQKDFEHLTNLSREIKVLKGISHLLDWDQETYMPEGASAIRAEQFEVLSGIIHAKSTSSEFKNALEKLIDIETGTLKSDQFDPKQKASLREWRKDFRQETCLPEQFIKDFAKLTSQSIVIWREARKQNGFHHFAPYLEKIIEMCRKKADLIGYKEHPYDALLDLYEPGITTKEVEKLFSELETEITPLVKTVSNLSIDDSFLHGKFSEEKQIAFSKMLLKKMDYDEKYGRLDFSTHPFSSASHPTDSRITTRIHPSMLMSNIYTVMHEAGHGLYEMGLPTEEYGTPIGEALSLGMHESQSRFWETHIGRSKAFWQFYYPLLQKEFPSLSSVPLEQFYVAINKVTPSFIRVEADEVTYSLHVILRFQIEKALIGGSLKVRDIPEVWNEKMKQFLNIEPKNYAEGCLQDVHWSMGGFGYFPSYTLGNIYAAQIFEAFEKQFPSWEEKIQSGDLSFIKKWLNESIHQYGRMYSSKEILQKITGHEITTKPYLNYLKGKFKNIEELSTIYTEAK